MERFFSPRTLIYAWNKIELLITIYLLLIAEQTFLRNSKYVVYGLVALLVLKHWKRVTYATTRDIILPVLVVLAAFSVMWSAAPHVTADEMDLVWRSTFFGVYIGARYTPKEQMQLLAWVCGAAAILSLIYILFIPSTGISFTNGEETWQGIYKHKQYLGRMMTLGAVIFALNLAAHPKQRWINLSGFILTTVMLVLARSTTSLIVFIIALLILSLQNFVKLGYKLKIFLLATITSLICIVSILILGNLEFIVVDFLGKDLTFSGRTEVWTMAIQKGAERFWLGYGYSGFWTSSESSQILNSTWALSKSAGEGRFHVHSGFIDLFLQLGMLGLALFSIGFFLTLSRVIVLLTRTHQIEFLCMFQILILKILFNTTETMTILSGNIFWPLYVSIVLSSIIQRQRLLRVSTREIINLERQPCLNHSSSS
ncbi:MAG: O-antigen ligase family protein [Leptolyngbya sp. SIO1E4]|nr:O-antigen ligase family protein [Leptolyngbya sp. SIO1E4]